MTRRGLLAALVLAGTGCTGATDRGDLIELVQRVALVPGADALDVLDPTPVGRDWRLIEFYLVEPLSQESIENFDPAVHLGLDALALESFSFNASPVGNIPPGARLRVRLAADENGIPEGVYRLRLKSPAGHRLVGASGREYDGSDAHFEFRVQVVLRDETLPYIVRFRVGNEGTPELIDGSDWFGEFEGVVPIEEVVPPHGAVRVEFSERMRTPVPVQGTPTILIPTTLQLRTFGTKQTTLTEIPGLSLGQSVEKITWFDFQDPHSDREVTVLTSDTVEGLELGTRYVLSFDGTPPLSSSQSRVSDVSGEPLTIRFLGGPGSDNPSDSLLRNSSWNDRRAFVTAPIKLTAPGHGSHLNLAAFAGGTALLSVSGELLDASADEIRLAVAPSDVSTPPSSTNLASITPSSDTTRLGLAIDELNGTVPFAASLPDGEYHVFAEAFDDSISKGWDVVRLRKDTVAPTLAAPLDFSALVTDPAFTELCLEASEDAVKVEILTPSGSVLAVATEFSDVFPGSGRRFCFDSIPVVGFDVGSNPVLVRVTDDAGNISESSGTLRLRPVIQHIAPEFASPGDDLFVTGIGLLGISDVDSIRFAGGLVRLSHGFLGDDPSGTSGTIFSGSGADVGSEFVRLRAPDFAASGEVAFVLADGTESTSHLLGLCPEVIGPFVGVGLLEDVDEVPVTFLGDIGMTGMLQTSTAGTLAAGLPIAYVFDGVGDLEARVFDPRSPDPEDDDWKTETVATAALPFAGAAQGPDGTPHVAFIRPGTLVPLRFWEVQLARRVFSDGEPRWETTSVAMTGAIGAPDPQSAVSLVVLPSGRRAVFYTGSGALDFSQPTPPDLFDTEPRLWMSVETAPGSRAFRSVVIERGAGVGMAISAAVGPDGDVWLAYNRDLHHAISFSDPVAINPLLAFRIDVKRIRVSGTTVGVVSTGFPQANGLWPSIAVSPLGEVGLSFQPARAFFDPQSGALRVSVDGLSFARHPSWPVESVDPEVGGTRGLGGLPSSGNINGLYPRSVLRYDRSGSPRIAAVQPQNGVWYWTRRLGGWDGALLEITPGAGATLGMFLNGVDEPQVGFHDERLGAFRFYSGTTREPLIPIPGMLSPCSEGKYVRSRFSADFEGVLDNHDGVDFNLQGLAGADPFDVALTAIRSHGINISATQNTQSLEVTTDGNEPFDVSRFFVLFGGDRFATARLRPGTETGSNARELEARMQDDDSESVSLACCEAETCGPAFVPPADPDECEAAIAGHPALECFALPPALACLATRRAPILLGGLAKTVPLLEKTRPIDQAGIRADIDRVFIRLEDLEMFGFSEHPGTSPGTAGHLVGLDDFELELSDVRVDNFPGDCEPFKLEVRLKPGAGGNLVAMGPPATTPSIRIGPVGTGPRTSARFGDLTLAAPTGFADVRSDAIELDPAFTGNEATRASCSADFAAGDFLVNFRRRLAKALASPTGDLRDTFGSVAEGLTDAIFRPVVDELVTDPRAREGIVFYIDPEGDPAKPLVVVHEP